VTDLLEKGAIEMLSRSVTVKSEGSSSSPLSSSPVEVSLGAVLRVVELKALVPHEACEDARALSLKDQLAEEDKLFFPPLVTPLKDVWNKCLVWDGHTRVFSLRALRLLHGLVQVIPDPSALELRSWDHVFSVSAEALLGQLSEIEGITLVPSDPAAAEREVAERRALALLHFFRSGETFVLELQGEEGEPSPKARADVLRELVAAYEGLQEGPILRLPDDLPLECAAAEHAARYEGLVRFARFRVGEVLKVVEQGGLMPAGVTRFLFPYRVCFRRGVALDFLRAPLPLAEKNRRLRAWLKRVHQNGAVRLYTEPILVVEDGIDFELNPC